MPRATELWADALANVDRRNPPSGKPWPFWIPHPSLLLHHKEGERYVINWLRLREAWYYCLDRPSLMTPGNMTMTTQHWHDYFHFAASARDPVDGAARTRSAMRRDDVKRIVTDVFSFSEQQVQFDCSSQAVSWFGQQYTSISDKTYRQVLWELCEVGFWVELRQLDRCILKNEHQDVMDTMIEEYERDDLLRAVFPYYSGLRPTLLPTAPIGLTAEDPRQQAPCLEALRQVVLRWKPVPAAIECAELLSAQSSAKYVLYMEREIAGFYVQRFFECSGCAAIIPRVFPIT